MLIHSGTGGVGQAAIAIARNAGAEIFATAGSDDRRESVARHGYRARLRLAQHRVRRADPTRHRTATASTSCSTRSPARPSARASNCWRFGGRFVEIGKRDIYGDTRLGLFPFRRNLTFYAVDLGLMSRQPPRQGARAAEHASTG